MANETKAISCPQCGSTDVEFENNVVQCHVCGAKTILEQTKEQVNAQNTAVLDEAVDEEDCKKEQVLAEFSKDQFIRKAWIELAKEDAPIEVFQENFGDVVQNDHEVLIDYVEVDVDYQVSVGYDREEPYIAYETYYEDEPYLTTETYYDSNTRSNRTRQVTKYKKVQRQRQVTKYKTVTDWSPLKGSHRAKSTAVVENKQGAYLDKNLFTKSFQQIENDNTLASLSQDEAREIKINKAAHDTAMSDHRSAIYTSVLYSLPGDHERDLDYNIKEVTEASSTLIKTPEYETSICYNGKTYSKHAFPFGSMEIGGDKIQNEVSLDAITKKMKADLESKNKERKDQIDKNVWKETSVLSYLTMGLLLLSIIISCFVRVTFLVVIVFIPAVASFVANTIFLKKKTEEVKQKTASEIQAETEKVEAEIADYSKNYKVKQREALNDKLKSLGYEPASASEL